MKKGSKLCDICTVLSGRRVYHSEPTKEELDLMEEIKKIKVKKR